MKLEDIIIAANLVREIEYKDATTAVRIANVHLTRNKDKPVAQYTRNILMGNRYECRFKNSSKKYRYRKIDTRDYDSFAEAYSERDNLAVNFIEERRVAFEKQSTDLATELIKTVSGGINYAPSIHDFAYRHPILKR